MLTQVYRQKEQGMVFVHTRNYQLVHLHSPSMPLILFSEFVDILNNMRLGNLTNAAVRKFHQLQREVKYEDSLRPTELYVLYLKSHVCGPSIPDLT